jgi:hypothetical protein
LDTPAVPAELRPPTGFCSKKLGGCFRFETLADSQPDRAVKALLASFGVIWVLDILAGIAAALFCLATIWKRKSPSSARRHLSLWTNIFAASFTCAVVSTSLWWH